MVLFDAFFEFLVPNIHPNRPPSLDFRQDMLYPTTVVEPGHAQYVFAGRHSSLMIDVDGGLWGWGCNEDGILGIGSGVAKQQVPIKIDTGGQRIRHAAGGWKHFLAVTEDGELLCCFELNLYGPCSTF